MSYEDIQIISELLLGITNTNKNIRVNSVSKLQELSKNNFNLLFFSLLEIIEKSSKNENQNLLKTTSLIICRKIIENVDYSVWKKIDKDQKIKMKYKLLSLLNNEINRRDNLKICDLIIELLEKIFEYEKVIWEELLSLILNIYNYDPNEGDKNSFQIISLLYIIKGGINFLYKIISKNLNQFVNYLEKIFTSINIDNQAKILAGQLVTEMLSFASTIETEILKKLIKNILISLYASYQLFEQNSKFEKDIKSFLKICIDIEGIDANLLEIYYQDIFNLSKLIISNKNFSDQKIREMGLELLISLIEDKTSLIINSSNKNQLLFSFFELILNYALEFDSNININSEEEEIYDNNAELLDLYFEDEIIYSISILERLFENIKSIHIENIFKIIIVEYFSKSWKYQYVILIVISTFSKFDENLNFFEIFLENIFLLANSNEKKVRLASIYCIKNLIKVFNKDFMNKNSFQIFSIFTYLLKNENNLKCKWEILNCLKYTIRYNSNDEFNNSIENIFDLLINMFGDQNNNVILRKLILLNVLELNNKKNNVYKNLLINKIDINSFMSYFINLYNKKVDIELYGTLLELIVSIGVYTPEKFDAIIPYVFNYTIKILKDFAINEKKESKNISISQISKSFKKIFPLIIKKYENKNIFFDLISTIISLIKTKNIMTINYLSDNDLEITNFLNEINDSNIVYQNIYNTQTEEFSSLLSLLITILSSVQDNTIIKKVFIDIENEIVPLINYRLDKYIRKKSSKILTKVILLMDNNEQKKMKSFAYINILINAIEKETDSLTTKYFFICIKEIIESFNEEFLSQEEINKKFQKFCEFINNIKIKRNQLLQKQNSLQEKFMVNKTKKSNKEELDDEQYINDLIIKDIEILEDIQAEITEILGILLKIHKNKSDYILEKIINNLIPSYLNSKNNFEIKMALFLIDDLIEYIGQQKLKQITWDKIYYIIIQLLLSEDNSIRQAAVYGIGIFALHTKESFDKYGKGLIEGVLNCLSFSINLKNENKIGNEEDFLLAFDNVTSAIGKIINYKFKEKIVQENLNVLIEKWIINLPIKYDESEQELQHEWIINLFISKRDIIPVHCYPYFFKILPEIYQTQSSNKKIDNQIEMIFKNYVKKEEKLKIILSQIYENGNDCVKNKLNILAQL